MVNALAHCAKIINERKLHSIKDSPMKKNIYPKKEETEMWQQQILKINMIYSGCTIDRIL